MNNSLHIIDGKLDPDPMTVNGTKDLVAMFYALNPKANRKFRADDNNTHPTSRNFFIKLPT